MDGVIASGIFFVAVLVLRLLYGTQITSVANKMKRRNSVKERVLKLRKQGKYNEIPALYRKNAQQQTYKFMRLNMLAMASMYEHNPEIALDLFRLALQGAVGKSVASIRSNMAIAYMQLRKYPLALNVCEEARKQGIVQIVPYTLCLVINAKWDEARNFYAQNAKGNDVDDEVMREILALKKDDPASIEAMRRIIQRESSLVLYTETVEDLYFYVDAEAFFQDHRRYTLLISQAKDILAQLETQPNLFSDSHVRFLRNTISMLIPRIGTPKECSALFGMVMDMSEFILHLDLPKELKENCRKFWRRLYLIYWRTIDFELYAYDDERDFIMKQLPTDSELVASIESKDIEVLKSPNYDITFCIFPHQFGYGWTRYVRVLPPEEANNVLSNIRPLVQIAKVHTELAEHVEPLLIKFLVNGIKIIPEDLKALASVVPSDHQQILIETAKHMEGKN